MLPNHAKLIPYFINAIMCSNDEYLSKNKGPHNPAVHQIISIEDTKKDGDIQHVQGHQYHKFPDHYQIMVANLR